MESSSVYSIYQSSNYGLTWSSIYTAGESVAGIASSASGQYLVVMGTYTYTSDDYGSTWTKNTSAAYNTTYVGMSATGQYVIADWSEATIVLSTNYGKTWSTGLTNINGIKGVAISSTGQYLGYSPQSTDYIYNCVNPAVSLTGMLKYIYSTGSMNYAAATTAANTTSLFTVTGITGFTVGKNYLFKSDFNYITQTATADARLVLYVNDVSLMAVTNRNTDSGAHIQRSVLYKGTATQATNKFELKVEGSANSQSLISTSDNYYIEITEIQ